MTLDEFIARWLKSGASERANKDLFLTELCDQLATDHPDVATGDAETDRYVFEADAVKRNAGKANSVGKMDLYKEGCFIFEAKQGSDVKAKKRGTARRDSPMWAQEMNAAYGQALGYAQTLENPPVFLIACDIGHSFDLYSCFDGSRVWRPFPTPQTSRFFLNELGDHLDTLKAVWTEPKSLDPSLHAAKVTREVAAHLAGLAKSLEKDGLVGERIATFLMRCLFTMFAEDVGLLPDKLFQRALKEHWLPHPASFPGGLRELWRAMNEGSQFGFVGKLLKFNGGLFKEQDVLPLQHEHLKLLLEAAECDWSQVEPSIFGTLLERALDPKERHRLGAHYTPRAYVERLVRPTIEEPLREEWATVQLEVRALLKADPPKSAKTADQKQKDQQKREEQARELVRTFHRKLCATRVLDPACGTGNFLYVTMDLFKRLEGEMLQLLHDLGDTQTFLHLEQVSVTPRQFLGIEVKRWAKEIAELVLWIGYLQWNFRTHRKGEMPPEPILQDYHNIECRDALLEWDGAPQLALDEHGKPITRWDGETYKKSPVTGEDIPDETARVHDWRYNNPRKAKWPAADYIVGNPPFIGSKRMRESLGDGYVDAIRGVFQEVPDGTDYVLYWWVLGAELLRTQKLQRYGFITTNSITQSMNRKATEAALFGRKDYAVVWAIPDHPWVESSSGAAVRIAMTVGGQARAANRLVHVVKEQVSGEDEIAVTLSEQTVSRIHSDLRSGAALASASTLRSNDAICSVALVRFGEGFVVDEERAGQLEAAVVHPLLTGRDLNQSPIARYVVDFFPMDELAARTMAPHAFQHVLEHVKPERDQIRDPGSKKRWWRFGRDKPELRRAITSIDRYIATSEVSKNRVFSFLSASVRPDQSLIVVASADGFVLGTLSARIHTAWAEATGSRLGVGNDLRYNRTRCFDPFPFPAATDAQRQRIRDLGEQLDAHRKRQQAAHPGLTITGMYNVLEKLRSGEALTVKERGIHEQGLVSVLKQLHDDLDAAVFDAYGWPHDLTDEQLLERLVALNAERAAEERRGHIRWLRPEFQNPTGTVAATQARLAEDTDEESVPDAKPGALPLWPKKRPEQIRAVRDLVIRGGAWTAVQVAASFKGAPAGDVESMLDDIESLGQLVSWEEAGVRSWGVAARAA
jgi:hypothetical protein